MLRVPCICYCMAKDFPCVQCGVSHPLGQHVPPSERRVVKRAGETGRALKKLEQLSAGEKHAVEGMRAVTKNLRTGEATADDPERGGKKRANVAGHSPATGPGLELPGPASNWADPRLGPAPEMAEGTPVIDWSQCPHCAAARAKHAARVNRYRKGKK